MALTDLAIRKATATGKVQRHADGGGLYLEVSPAGGKWWRFKYPHGGKEKRLSLGTYPDTGLADARAKHAAARKLLAAGVILANNAKLKSWRRRNAAQTRLPPLPLNCWRSGQRSWWPGRRIGSVGCWRMTWPHTSVMSR